MLSPGAAAWLAVAAGLCAAFRRTPRRRAFPLGGRLALGAGALAEALLLSAAPGAATCFVPAMLTAFAAAVDAAVYALRGHSPMRARPDAFAWMAVLSIFLWVVFEIYNERLAAWHYGGLPGGATRYLLLGWAFAMIWPGGLGTAAFLSATVFRGPPGRAVRTPTRLGPRLGAAVSATGALCLTLPLLLPRLDVGERLFGLVVCGWAALLNPLNARAGLPSHCQAVCSAAILRGNARQALWRCPLPCCPPLCRVRAWQEILRRRCKRSTRRSRTVVPILCPAWKHATHPSPTQYDGAAQIRPWKECGRRCRAGHLRMPRTWSAAGWGRKKKSPRQSTGEHPQGARPAPPWAATSDLPPEVSPGAFSIQDDCFFAVSACAYRPIALYMS